MQKKMGPPTERDPPPYPGHLPPQAYSENDSSMENLSACTRQEPQGQENSTATTPTALPDTHFLLPEKCKNSILHKLGAVVVRNEDGQTEIRTAKRGSKLPQGQKIKVKSRPVSEYENVKSSTSNASIISKLPTTKSRGPNELLQSLKNPFRKYMEAGTTKNSENRKSVNRSKLPPPKTVSKIDKVQKKDTGEDQQQTQPVGGPLKTVKAPLLTRPSGVPTSSSIRIASHVPNLFIRKEEEKAVAITNNAKRPLPPIPSCRDSLPSSRESSICKTESSPPVSPGIRQVIHQLTNGTRKPSPQPSGTAPALNNRVAAMRQKFQDGRECLSADNTRPTSPKGQRSPSLTQSNPDLMQIDDKKPINEIPPEKKPEETECLNITARTARMIKILSKENRTLREQLQTNCCKVAKLQQLEEEMARIKDEYDNLSRQNKKREHLERSVRLKLEDQLRTVEDENLDMRKKLERLMRKLEEKEILDHSNDSDLYLEMRKKDAIISHLLAQNKKYCNEKERLQVELAAQRVHCGMDKATSFDASYLVNLNEEQEPRFYVLQDPPPISPTALPVYRLPHFEPNRKSQSSSPKLGRDSKLSPKRQRKKQQSNASSQVEMNHDEPREETSILQKILQDMRDKDKKIADLETRIKNNESVREKEKILQQITEIQAQCSPQGSPKSQKRETNYPPHVSPNACAQLEELKTAQEKMENQMQSLKQQLMERDKMLRKLTNGTPSPPPSPPHLVTVGVTMTSPILNRAPMLFNTAVSEATTLSNTDLRSGLQQATSNSSSACGPLQKVAQVFEENIWQ